MYKEKNYEENKATFIIRLIRGFRFIRRGCVYRVRKQRNCKCRRFCG